MPIAKRRTGSAPADSAPAPVTPARTIRPAAARARGAANAPAPQPERRERGTLLAQTSAYDQETVEEDTVSEVVFPPGVEPASVRFALGKTISMGPGTYEFLRIDVSVTLPCLPNDLEATYERAADFATDKLLAEEREWLGTVQPKPKANRR